MSFLSLSFVLQTSTQHFLDLYSSFLLNAVWMSGRMKMDGRHKISETLARERQTQVHLSFSPIFNHVHSSGWRWRIRKGILWTEKCWWSRVSRLGETKLEVNLRFYLAATSANTLTGTFPSLSFFPFFFSFANIVREHGWKEEEGKTRQSEGKLETVDARASVSFSFLLSTLK